MTPDDIPSRRSASLAECHIPAEGGWMACTTVTGMPCTIARCRVCDRHVWSDTFGPRETWVAPSWGENFRHVVRWYHFRLRRVIRERRRELGSIYADPAETGGEP